MEPKLFQHLLRIEDLNVEDMNSKQVAALYKFMEETKDLKLKNFTFGVNSATFIMEEDVLARTWPRLERIVVSTDRGLGMPPIFHDQVEAVFKEILNSKDVKLKSVRPSSHIRPELPAKLLTDTKKKIRVLFSDDEDSEED